jgi:hypothetical protein
VRRRRLAAATLGALAAGGLLAPAAQAHGLVGRTDLPIPKWLFGWAAAVVLAVSFLALAVLWPKPRLQSVTPRRLIAFGPAVDVVCGAIGIALFGLVVYAGFAGTQTATANLAPTWIYVIFWVGIPFASVAFGNVFALFSPWRALARAVAWVAGRFSKEGLPAPLEYPKKLGRWPAVAVILGFTWLELVYLGGRDSPSKLAAISVGYAAVMLLGMSFYGIEAWSRNADGFSVLFGIYGRLSAFQRREGALWLRPPLSGVTSLDMVPGTVALLCTAIGTTSFDGFSQGPVWKSIEPDLEKPFTSLGLGSQLSTELAFTVGLAACVLIVGALFRIAVKGMSQVGEGHSPSELAGKFAHTLAPIAFAYVVAHYFSLLVYQSQALAFLASDPLGKGSDLFGTAGTQIDYNVIRATGIWYAQVAALVIGHVSGLILAHDRALAIYDKPREAVRSQYWMLLVMVGFTSLGLWLLSAANQ